LCAKETKVTPTRVTPLIAKTLAGMPGKEGSPVVVEYAPGTSGSAHRHNAHMFVYVPEGSVSMQVKGRNQVTQSPGGIFYENPTDIHVVGRNASKTAAAKFPAFLVKDAGAPATVPVP
jgi:quercetin dioxygenase-like cupin family protein